MENQWMYQIMKVYIRCTESLDLLRNLTLLKVQNNENSMENSVRLKYRSYEFVLKFEFDECTKLWKLKEKYCTLNVQIVRICWKNWMCKIMKMQMKIEEDTKLSKLNGKLIKFDVQIVQICFQIWSRQMYKIVKIQFKTMY